MRFLVIQTAFIGDVILATPVFTELKRIYPEASIDVLVRKGNEPLLAHHPAVNQVLVFNKKEGKLRSLFQLLKQIRKNGYDEVINLHRFASSGLLAAFSGAPSRVGFDKNPFSWRYTQKRKHQIGNGTHEVSRNLSCIKHHGAASFARPLLVPSPADYQKTLLFKKESYYCLAPASVWFTKQLPENKWVELVKLLTRKGTVYLLGGPGDNGLCERIKLNSGENQVENLAGQFSFLESATLMQYATMNYVNDSGPLHFCSAVNAPVTAFFCSTTPEFGFGPLSENAQIIEASPKPSCKPCGLHGYKACPKGHFACGQSISISE